MAFLIKTVLFLAAASPVRSVSIVRRDTEPHREMLVNADGEMTHMDKEDVPSICNDDFPLGKDKTNLCTHPADQEILSRELCMEAANQASVYTSTETFTLMTNSFAHHPQGCFKIKCSEAHHATVANNLTSQPGDCFFYNPVGYKPTEAGLAGVPVCSRPKIINGTADKNGECNSESYELITKERKCGEVASCLSYCTGAEFRADVHNASRYNDFPNGCFIHDKDGCVYFNTPPPHHTAMPTHPKGISLCEINIGKAHKTAGVTGTGAKTAAEIANQTAAITAAQADASDATNAAADVAGDTVAKLEKKSHPKPKQVEEKTGNVTSR